MQGAGLALAPSHPHVPEASSPRLFFSAAHVRVGFEGSPLPAHSGISQAARALFLRVETVSGQVRGWRAPSEDGMVGAGPHLLLLGSGSQWPLSLNFFFPGAQDLISAEGVHPAGCD